ncbi:MAG TPA: ABC transporter ATP-binding protein, partial [Thermoprotei archaeon]|nr:ABC transporter ATP-binding protein [Thermoprotei archaeon]
MKKILDIVDLYSGYGKLTIIQGVSLYVRDGEIISIIGPNGSGKTTLIKTVFGLTRIFSGKIFYNNIDITGKKPHIIASMGIGYVPQRDNVFTELTVEENLEIGAYLNHVDKIDDIREKIFQMFPILSERRKQKAGTLSGGERQMLAIGRALMSEPKLLLLDEPTAALAPKIVKQLLKKISEIRDQGVTIVLVEQNARSALEISDRGYVLVTGRKVLEDESKRLLSNPDLGKIYLGQIN